MENKENKTGTQNKKTENKGPKGGVAKSVYSDKKKKAGGRKPFSRSERPQDEFEQRIVDIARVTRVMAGGKRMRFRACVVVGNGKGKVGYGLAKGADVTIAVQKAGTNARKNVIDVPMINETIPHEVYLKKGAAKVLLKPAGRGKGVIAGGATRTVLELSGIKNVTSKNLGTNNKVNITRCTIEALESLKKIETGKKTKKQEDKKEKKEKQDKK